MQGGTIAALLAPGAAAPAASPSKSAAGLHVFPGLIDATCTSASARRSPSTTPRRSTPRRAASPRCSATSSTTRPTPTCSRASRATREARCHVDFGFHFRTANELHIKELGEYVARLRRHLVQVLHEFQGRGRPLPRPGRHRRRLLLRPARGVGARRAGRSIVCHTENIEIVNRVRRQGPGRGRQHAARTGRASKPPITESEPACARCTSPSELGARVYFPHISSRKALDEVRNWRQRYKDVIVETCPHYLTHTEDSELGGMGKANPPFRTQGRPGRALGSDLRRHRRPRRLRPLRAQEGEQGQAALAGVAGLSRRPRACCR